MVKANKTLTESLVNNLIVNAIRHNIPGGSIRMEIGDNSFSVANTGGDSELDTTKIFQRFSRSSEEKKGNGLGLSIVAQIAKLHGWTVEYNYMAAQKLHEFAIKFSGTSK